MSPSSQDTGASRIGIIGGSGVEEALTATTDAAGSTVGPPAAAPKQTAFPDTPFGKPSAPITLTTWQGVEVAILPNLVDDGVLREAQHLGGGRIHAHAIGVVGAPLRVASRTLLLGFDGHAIPVDEQLREALIDPAVRKPGISRLFDLGVKKLRINMVLFMTIFTASYRDSSAPWGRWRP